MEEHVEAVPVPEAVPPPPLPPPSPPRSVRGRDLLMGVGILWAVELLLGLGLVGIVGGHVENAGPVAVFACTALGLGITALVSWHFVCRKYGRTLVDGFAIRPVGRRTAVISVLTGLGGAVVGVGLLILFGTGKSFMDRLMADPTGFALMMPLVLSGPIIEETYYRGFLFPVLRKKLGAGAALFLVTVWFGASHAVQVAGDWVALPVIVAMGLVWTLLRHRSESLVPSMVSHWTYNAVLFAVSIVWRIAGG